RARGQQHGEDPPRDVPAEVVVERDGQEAAGDGDHRGHRDDVADPGDQRRGDRAGAAEGLPHERDETAGGRLRPENWDSVLPSSATAMIAAMMVRGEATP